MTDVTLAWALVDAFGALGVLSLAFVLAMRPTRTQVQDQLLFVFGLAGAFYATRSAANATGMEVFVWISLVLACTLPLGALLLAEVLLRRHAPRILKLLIGGGAAVGVTAALLVGVGMQRAFSLTLYVPTTLLAVLMLIVTRHRSELAPLENATLNSFARGLLVTTLLSLTDLGFGAPFGLSALGALGLAYAAASGRSAERSWIDTGRELAPAAATALLLTWALLLMRPQASWTEAGTVLAVTTAALLALSVLLRLQSGGADRKRRLFEAALAAADTTDLRRFVGQASQHAPLQGLILAEPADLGDYEPARLRAAFAAGPVVSLARLRSPGPGIDQDSREQMRDLLTREASTHAILVSAEPLRLALAATGTSARPEDDDAAMLMFQKLAALVAAREPLA